MGKALAADAVLFGAVGGPKWDKVPYEVRPEAGLLRLRKDMELFANLRPAICYPALAASSSLKQEVVEGLDILIVRELTGGVYFGEPKEIIDLGNGQKRGIDTQVYDTFEIERISGVAFELARTRRNHVTSMEKRNVMKSGVLWNEVVTETHKRKYADVKLDHMLADAGGMQLVRWPKQFDVIVTDNLFGDMLSDVAAMLTGSLGMLPSASLGAPDAKTGKRKALYEPVHGSAPDISGKGIANPIAMIASFAMCLRYSFNMVAEADRLEAAIAAVLDQGYRTKDIMSDGMKEIGTTAMGDAIIEKFRDALMFADPLGGAGGRRRSRADPARNGGALSPVAAYRRGGHCCGAGLACRRKPSLSAFRAGLSRWRRCRPCLGGDRPSGRRPAAPAVPQGPVRAGAIPLGRAWVGLLRFLAGYCIAQGIGRIDLTTEDWNEGALRFYDRLGAERHDQKIFFRFTPERLTATG